MSSKESTKELRELSKQRTKEVLNQPGSTQRFAPSPLATINPAFARTTSFLPPSMANPFAGSMQQQRARGANYLNYETMAPNVGGPLLQPQPPADYVPAGTQPQVIRVNPDGTPTGDEDDVDLSDPDRFIINQQEFLDEINEERADKGLPPFNTFQEYINDQIDVSVPGYIGMADGGIASLQPQGMFIGGLMSAIGQGAAAAGGALAQGAGALGGAAAKGLGSLKDIALKGMQNYNANMAARSGGIGGLSEKRIEDMTREELIEFIKTGKKPSGGLSADLKTIAGQFMPSEESASPSSASLNMMGFAGGGDVDFPRMNGPISGPGTETSDDIPAMLSDGEFVVNAKAVRGIGRLEGAGKSKAEQRREGARMMYALQRAGEKAMRKA